MGQAKRNRRAGRTNPPRVFTGETLLDPVREAVLSEIKQGQPKPSVIVVDATTEGTNWMPGIVDDTGVPGLPVAMCMYATVDDFAKVASESNHPVLGALERVRQSLMAHPDDVVVITLDDHGVGITEIEMTATADGHKVTMEQASAAFAGKRQGMDELLHEGAKRA